MSMRVLFEGYIAILWLCLLCRLCHSECIRYNDADDYDWDGSDPVVDPGAATVRSLVRNSGGGDDRSGVSR